MAHLIARAGEGGTPVQKLPDAGRILGSSELADVFGIEFGGVDAKTSHSQESINCLKTQNQLDRSSSRR
jgi:hypothetical protein